MTSTAKLINDPLGQAVRLPDEFRMPGDHVSIRKEGDRLILEPVAASAFDTRAWLAKMREHRKVPFPEPSGDGSILDDPENDPIV